MIEGHRGHIKTVGAHQGHIVSGTMEAKGHGTPPGMRRQDLLIWLMGLSKGHMIRDLTLLDLSLHPRHGKEDNVRYVENQVATQTSTEVYLGIHTEAVTYVENEDVTRSSIEVKNVGFKVMTHLNRHVVRKTVRGDRERATGPRRRTRAARHPSPLRRRWD